MKQTTAIFYATLVFFVIFVTFFEDAVAESIRQCHTEVRDVMVSEGIKKLDAGDLKIVNENCKQGNVNSATKYVKRIGAYKRCTQFLNDHIKSKRIKVDKKTFDRARGKCRRGDLQKAIELVSTGLPAKGATKPYKRPRPTKPPLSTKEPAAPAKIISFVTNKSKIKKGESVNLSWRTENANTVTLSKRGAKDIQTVQTSGSQSVSPDKTTTYLLMAGRRTKGSTAMVSKLLQVTVSTPPNRTCSITGNLTGKWKQLVYEQLKGPGSMWTVDVEIYAAGSDKMLRVASVANKGIYGNGKYRFNGLDCGKKYTLIPSWDSSPPERNVSFSAGKSHRNFLGNFTITGSPSYD